VNKYLHTVASVGFLFTLNYDARNHELKIQKRSLTGYHITLTGVFIPYNYVKHLKLFYPSTAQRYQYTSPALREQTTSCQSQAIRAINCPYDTKQSDLCKLSLKTAVACFSETSVFTSQVARCHGDANFESDFKLA